MANLASTTAPRPTAPRNPAPPAAGGAPTPPAAPPADTAGNVTPPATTPPADAGERNPGGAQNSMPGTAPANTAPQPSPSGFFGFTAFGAVKVETVTTRAPANLTEDQRKQFADAEAYFSANTNKHVLSVNFSTKAEAKAFRGLVEAYAADVTARMATKSVTPDHLSASFPKAGKGNDYPEIWNSDLNVTFRLARGKYVTPEVKAERKAKREATKAANAAAKAAAGKAS